MNVWRLRQLQRLTREIKQASSSRLSLDWLKPFSRRKATRIGEQLFRRGDTADEVMFVLSGRYRAVEADVVLGQGDVIGELGLVAKDQRRTQTVVCEEDGTLLVLSYDEARQMYFQNPSFGFFFLGLVADRLSQDANRARMAVSPSTAPPAGAAGPV